MNRHSLPTVVSLFLFAFSYQAVAQELTLDDVFPTDRVLDVQITLDKEDWDTIRQQSRNFFDVLQEKRKFEPIEGPYTYVDAGVTIDGVKFPQVGVRKKGFIGSLSDTRPSLKIKLNHVDKKGGIEGLTNLTFNNNQQDTTLVSQFMGYALFNAAGSPAPRCAYARVTVNGKYLGVYSHVESMRKPLFERAYGNDKGTLYEGTVVDFHEGWEESFEKKFGKDKPGRKHIKKLIVALQEESDDADYEQKIGELVDLDAFYTFWAVEGLIGFWDGYSSNYNNFFVYLNPETDKFHFLPWGLDVGYEKISKLDYDPKAPVSVKTKGMVAHKLYQLESGRERYRKTLMGLLDKHWDEKALLAETDRIEALLKPHLGPSQSEHAQSLNKVRQFIRTRRAELVAEIADGMPIWTRVPEPPPVIPAEFAKQQDPNSIWNAAKTGSIDTIKERLKEGVEVDAGDFSGSTPLAFAALAGQSDVVEFLIDQGADVNATNRENSTALHGAAFLGQLEVVQLLIDNKVDVNVPNIRGETPLDGVAVGWNNEIQGIIQFIGSFLQLKVDVEAVKAGRPKVAELLRKHGAKSGAELPKPVGKGLWESVKSGDIEAIKKHLAKDDVDVNAQDTNGITPLSWAALAGHAKVAELLIEEGANVNLKNRDGASPLHAAAFLGRVEIVALLIKSKAEVNAKNNMGETPLDSSAAEWSDDIQGIVQFIGTILQLKIDLEEVKTGRPKAAALLRKHGGKLAADL